MIILRDYQSSSIDALRDGIRAGHKRQVLCAPTGSGKTECGMALVQEALGKFSNTAFICDRLAILDQTSQRFDTHSIPHGVIQAGHWRFRPHEHAQICSAQTLARRGILDGLKLIIVDECFVAGTLIATPSGLKPIELVRSGDIVYNAIGVGVVRGTSCKSDAKRRIVTVRLDNGNQIECTADHRFLTTDAWVPAWKLAGKSVVMLEGMPYLWGNDEAHGKQKRQRELASAFRKNLAKPGHVLQILRKEIEEPHALVCQQGKDGRDVEADRSSTKESGRERATNDQATASAVADTWRLLARGVRFQDITKKLRRLSASLQNRLGKSNSQDCGRSGRERPLLVRKKGAGREEGRALGLTRVVSVQTWQRACPATVYNLHVGGHPSYFANGVLVHNCHTLYRTTVQFILNHPEIVTVGLTATPFAKGLGEVYTNVVNLTTTQALVDQAYLAPVRIFAAKEIDMKGARLKSSGEWAEEEMEERGLRIVGDVVEEWITKTNELFGGPVKTIVFSATVAHGEELCRQWNARGYDFRQVSYRDGNDQHRRDMIEEFRAPDSQITGLVSCEALAKGFDVPDILCGVACRPYRKSLSSHIQQLGRVMRPAPGKTFALWNCHSGNAVRFYEDMVNFFEFGLAGLPKDHLDSTARKEKEEKEKAQIVCKCGYVLSPSAEVCPNCGAARPRRKNRIDDRPGFMLELTGANGKKLEPWLADKQAVAAQIWHYALDKKHGDQEAARKFGLAQFRNIYGEWPYRRIETLEPIEPDIRLVQRIRANLIRWHYRNAGAAK